MVGKRVPYTYHSSAAWRLASVARNAMIGFGHSIPFRMVGESATRPGNIGPPIMNNLFRLFIAAAVLTLAAGPASSADSLSETQKKEVEGVIQDYLQNNPEIITKAIEVLQARKREAESSNPRRRWSPSGHGCSMTRPRPSVAI